VKHVAIVPVEGLDGSTRRALHYASTLTPRVVAVHMADGSPSRLADSWAEDVPLVVLEGRPDSKVLLRAIQVLKGAEQAERVSLVVAAPGRANDLPRVLGPGVVLCPLPTEVSHKHI
jgi:hypothetical protein